jgi:hypothetical protein
MGVKFAKCELRARGDQPGAGQGKARWMGQQGEGQGEGQGEDKGGAKKARLRKARRLLIVPFKTKILMDKLFYTADPSF